MKTLSEKINYIARKCNRERTMTIYYNEYNCFASLTERLDVLKGDINDFLSSEDEILSCGDLWEIYYHPPLRKNENHRDCWSFYACNLDILIEKIYTLVQEENKP